MKKVQIKVPRLNPNDDELLVVEIKIKIGDFLTKGQKIFTFETTKTSIDFESEYSGKVTNIYVKKNDYVKVGSEAFELEIQGQVDSVKDKSQKIITKISKKLTLKAEKIAKENKVNLNEIKT